jgi:hypothetical protein
MQKKITIMRSLMLLTAAAVLGQDFKKFRVGVGGGYAHPGGEGAKGGVLFYVEPGYRVNDMIIANLRMEFAGMVRGAGSATSGELDVATTGSYTVNGQYYFSNENFRPFVGAGFGIYKLASGSVAFDNSGSTTTTVNVSAESKIGFYPRIGFDMRHFTVSIDYNIISPTEAGTYEIKNSYLGVRIGGFFGGGRK